MCTMKACFLQMKSTNVQRVFFNIFNEIFLELLLLLKLFITHFIQKSSKLKTKYRK